MTQLPNTSIELPAVTVSGKLGSTELPAVSASAPFHPLVEREPSLLAVTALVEFEVNGRRFEAAWRPFARPSGGVNYVIGEFPQTEATSQPSEVWADGQ